MGWTKVYEGETEYDGKITFMGDSEGISFILDDGIQEISTYAPPFVAIAAARAILKHFNATLESDQCPTHP